MKYPSLPVVQCDPNCGDCCGPAPCRDDEYATIATFIAEHDIQPKDNGQMTCPFYQGGTCAIYEVRPMVCRLFGHVDRMRCSRGYSAPITPRREREINQRYGVPTRLLHEFLKTATT